MPRKRSLPTSGSVISSTSTESTASVASSVRDVDTNSIEGWMYWKRDAQCWTKVFVVLRHHFVWLLRSDASTALASPLIHMAVVGVERTTLRSFRITGPSQEAMELHLYDADDGWLWFDAFLEATTATRMSLKELQEAAALGRRQSSYPRLSMVSSSSSASGVDQAYRGTLVVYNQERQGSRFRQMVRSQSQRIKASIRKRVEEIVDRFDTTQTRATLC